MNNPFLRTIWRIVSSRSTAPIIIGLYLLLYIGIAFKTENALMALIDITSSSVLLIGLFALIPLNFLLCLAREISVYVAGRRQLAGDRREIRAEMFDEVVMMAVTAFLFVEVERRLVSYGYSTRHSERSMLAWRGIDRFPVRALFLVATVLLFSGIFISLGSRTSYRGTVIEGEPFPAPSGVVSGVVERIVLTDAPGPLLGKALRMEVAASSSGDSRKTFGIYPPSHYQGAFVYPRYLGIGVHYRLVAPDLPAGYEARDILNIYPSGKEDSREIPGSRYRLVLSMMQSEDVRDPYMTGLMSIQFKMMKGNELVVAGSSKMGEKFNRDGYELSVLEARRVVITDFIKDPGVFIIWGALLLYVGATLLWLPVRCFFPRQEMVFVMGEAGKLHAGARSEGRRRRHMGVFHEALDTFTVNRISI